MKFGCYLLTLFIALSITSATVEETKNSLKKRKRSKQVIETVEVCEAEGPGIIKRLSNLSSPTLFDTNKNNFNIFLHLIQHLSHLDYKLLDSRTEITVFAPTDGAFFEFTKSKYDLKSYDEGKVFSLVIEYVTTFGERETGGQRNTCKFKPLSDFFYSGYIPSCDHFDITLCKRDGNLYIGCNHQFLSDIHFCNLGKTFGTLPQIASYSGMMRNSCADIGYIFFGCDDNFDQLYPCRYASFAEIGLINFSKAVPGGLQSANLFREFIFNHFIQNKHNIADLQTTDIEKGVNMIFSLPMESNSKTPNFLKVTRHPESVEIQSNCGDSNFKTSKVMKEYSYCNENIIVIDWPLEFSCNNS